MPANHNHTPASSPELSAEARAILDIRNVQEWRDTQNTALSSLRRSLSNGYENEFNNSIDDMLDSFLRDKGIADDDASRDEIRQILRDASIDRVSDDEWGNRPSARGVAGVADDRPEKYKIVERIDTILDASALDSPDPTSDLDADVEEERRVERLEELRQAKHDTYAARISGGFFGRKSRQQEYDNAEAAYAIALEEDIRIRLEQALGDDLNDEQRLEITKDLIEAEIKKDEAEQYRALMEKGGRRAAFLARYEKMSTKKKIGVGVLMATGGMAAGFVAGLAGAGIAVVGAGMAGYRLGRASFLAKSRTYREPSDQIDFTYDTASGDSAEKQAVKCMNERSRSRIDLSDKTRERAVKVGIGAAALGGALGAAGGAAGVFMHTDDVHVGGDRIGLGDGHWRGGYLEHLDKGMSDNGSVLEGGNDVDKGMSDNGSVLEGGNDVDKGMSDNGSVLEGGNDVDPAQEKEWLLGGDTGPSSSLSSDSFKVESGHGYTHELIEQARANGVYMTSQQAWEAHQTIVDAVGSDYIDLNLNGHTGPDTYSMGSTPYDTGISMPGDATWSADAQSLVADAADDGVINGSVDHGVAPDHTDVGMSDADIIDQSKLDGLDAAQADNADWVDMNEDFESMKTHLMAGDIDAINQSSDYQDTLSHMQHDLKDLRYRNSTVAVLGQDANGRWIINKMPDGAELPRQLESIFAKYQSALSRLAA